MPQGLVTPEETYFFNQENTVAVVFRGYINIDEQSFSSQYDTLISESGYEKGMAHHLISILDPQ
ncbi:DUF4176 domain-containing protein [Streptococcus suis]|uniref:DUF4176 domain-containing protein n=1 Tax=Streptococcus suis TaxID=1307 RepID=UPI001E4696A5|nr:DUF4176 domain-containing protein [Streptococcus suis]